MVWAGRSETNQNWSVSPVTDTPSVPYPATCVAVSTGTQTRCPGAAGPFSLRTALGNQPPAPILASLYAAFQSKQLLITHGFMACTKTERDFALRVLTTDPMCVCRLGGTKKRLHPNKPKHHKPEHVYWLFSRYRNIFKNIYHADCMPAYVQQALISLFLCNRQCLGDLFFLNKRKLEFPVF